MHRSDIPAGLRLSEAAHWNQTAADWEFFLQSNPDGCCVADIDGAVVATVATIRFGDAFGWVAMVLVDPSHRRTGLGTRMLHEALAMLSDMPTVRLDATPQGRRVYVPLGFRDEYALQRMVCPANPRYLHEHEPVEQMTDEDFERVAAADAAIIGADRRLLLEMLRRNAPEYARVVRGASDSVSAYAFGRRGRTFEHVGPMLAPDEASARSLLSACLAVPRLRPLIMDVPVRPSWVSWLASSGFTTQRPFARMYRGVRHSGERTDAMFAIAGPEFG